jgi:hypothetical protein
VPQIIKEALPQVTRIALLAVRGLARRCRTD